VTSTADVLADARAALTAPTGERPQRIVELDEALAAVGDELRASLLDPGRRPPEALADGVERLYEVCQLQADLRERALFERLDVLARIQESIAQLQEYEAPEELIDAAPRELCRSCGFTRALLSRVEGSRWIPEVIETVPGMDPEEARFAEYIASAEILLEHMLLETELVRRRMPALVTDPLNDPRTFKDIVTRGRTVAYVAAPIMPAGRVIGFLHADRIGQDHPVSAEDRDNLWAFAEQFGLIYERAVLLERLHEQRTQLREAFTEAGGVVEELWKTEIEFARADRETPDVTRTAADLFRRSESRLDTLLTRREREVLELMTSGATNSRIAEQLVLSEGTVKSHVKHVLRKLHASSRAEAVARYLRIEMRDREDAPR
jgi:DNA-binding CsgD family transcriptional regulator